LIYTINLILIEISIFIYYFPLSFIPFYFSLSVRAVSVTGGGCGSCATRQGMHIEKADTSGAHANSAQQGAHEMGASGTHNINLSATFN
jgi:hypothetical protein